MAKTLQQRIRRNRQQNAVLTALFNGANIADALIEGNVSWFDFRRWWLYQPAFRQKWSLAGERLRDALVQEAVEKVRKGDDDALKTLLTVRDPNLTFAKALRVKQAQRQAWGRQAVREAKAEIRQRKKLLRDIELGRAPSIGNSGSSYKPPPRSST